MKLSDARQEYYTYSAKASDVARQLGFAGIAIIWIFNSGTGGAIQIPRTLIWAGLLIVLGLAADFLHYASGAVVWGTLHRFKERSGVSETANFMVHRSVNWPTLTFFVVKLFAIGAGYAVLATHLARAL